MKKIFQKIFVAATSILLVLTFSCFFKVNAELTTTDKLVVNGAAVRTDEKAGLKFEALSTYTPAEGVEVKTYGIVVMLGEYTAEEVYIGATNAFDAKVSKTDDDGYFYLTIFGFPEAAYVREITARAFVVLNDDSVVYADTVTVRSLAKVAIGAKELQVEGDFIDTVVNHVAQNYVKEITLDNGNVVLDKPIYESNYTTLAKEFIADWNTMFETTLDATSAFLNGPSSTWYKSAKTSTQSSWANSKLKTFFQDEAMYAKWGWIFNYITTELTNGTGYSFAVAQINAIKNNVEDTTNWYYGGHLCGFIMSIMSGSKQSSGWGHYTFENNPSKLGLIANYNDKIFADLSNVEFVKIGSDFVLPNTTVETGYKFDGWYLDSTKYNAKDKVSIAQNTSYVFVPKMLEYLEVNVKYDLNDGSITYDTLDEAIADFLADFNAYFATQTSYNGVVYTADSFYALGSYTNPIGPVSNFLYNDTYKAKWTWLVNYIATVASSANKAAFTNFYSYSSQSELHTANTNYIYCIAYELRGWVGQAQYTKNSSFKTADYGSDDIKAKSLAALPSKEAYVYKNPCDLITPETRTGYTFIGWKSSVDGTIVSEYPGYTTAPGDITYTAQWYANVNVTFDLNGGVMYESLDAVIADFLNDYNTYKTSLSASHVPYTVETFYELGPWEDLSVSRFLYNKKYKEKWRWLVNYLGTVASSQNEKAFTDFYNYDNQLEFNEANNNYIYMFAYEVRAWVAQAPYTQNSNYVTADYSSAEIQASSLSAAQNATNFVYIYPSTLPTPVRSGYKFVGWKSSVDGTIITEYPGYSVNPGDITYTAQWEAE